MLWWLHLEGNHYWNVQTLPDISNFKVRNLDSGSLWRPERNWNNNNSKTCTKFVCVGMKAWGGEGSGRLLQRDNAGGRWSYCGRSVFRVMEFWFKVNSFVCVCMYTYMIICTLSYDLRRFWLVLDLLDRTCCVCWRVSV